MTMSLQLGVDMGTTSVKSHLLRVDSGEATQSHQRGSADVSRSRSVSTSEQNITDILEALLLSVAQCTKDQTLTDIHKVAVCGQMHGVILWCKDTRVSVGSAGDVVTFSGGPVSTLITWEDKRCTEPFLQSLPPSKISPLSSGFGCCTLFWLMRHQPDYISQFDHAGTIADFIVSVVLCGGDGSAPVMSDHNAASWGYYDIKTGGWQTEILANSGFPTHLLPPIVKSGSKDGVTASDNLCGLPAGVDVYVATGDAQCSVMSTGFKPSQAVLNMGTSCQLSLLTPEDTVLPADHPHIQIWPYHRGKHLLVAASMNGGNVLAGFVHMLTLWTKDLGFESTEESVWSKLSSLESVSKDNQTEWCVQITPTMLKERATTSDGHQGASVTHITADNVTLSSVYRQLCRSLIDNIQSMISQRYLQRCGVSDVLCTGSIFKRQPLIYEAVRSVYSDMTVGLIDDADAAYGAILMTT